LELERFNIWTYEVNNLGFERFNIWTYEVSGLRKSIVGDLKDSISGLTKSRDFVSQEKRKSNFKA